MKSLMITAIAFLALLTTSCMENKSENKAQHCRLFFQKVKKVLLKILPAMHGIRRWLQMTACTTQLLETSILNQEQEAIGIPIRQVKY